MANRRRRGGAGRGRGRSKAPKKVGQGRLPARSSSARDDKRGNPTVRLNKYLADHGIASRRACDDLIESGKVMIDGEPVSALGTKVDPTTQVVEVDGVALKPEGMERRYYLLNKPSGVVCTSEKRETRPRAVDLITDPNKGRIYTVGRLDEDSLGLILLTNDGEFAQRVAHPRFGVPKTYKVRVQGKIEDETLQKVRDGVHLSEGRTAGARIIVKRRTVSGSMLEVTIREGKNREVRRVFARVGHKVTSLVRTRIGPMDDRGLKVGRWRPLSRAEVESMLDMSTAEGAKLAMEMSADGAAPARGTEGRGRTADSEGRDGYGERRAGPRGAGPRGRGARRGGLGRGAGRGGSERGPARGGARRSSSRGGGRGMRSGMSPLDALEQVERGRRTGGGARRSGPRRSRRRRG